MRAECVEHRLRAGFVRLLVVACFSYALGFHQKITAHIIVSRDYNGNKRMQKVDAFSISRRGCFSL